ncbi:MAG: motility associated factor glycosyltransferase family protein [Epulopiscium sp.]|nr:motility associated factor glycosyltransferase family protein [Candidatus Epulonipiscium sp.]
MSSSLFEKNARQYNKIYGKNLIDSKDNSNVVLEKTKDDNYTVKLKYLTRELYLHSKYSPIKEAKRFVEKIEDYNIKTVFIIYGMGLGYHIMELMKYLHKDNPLIIIEPDEEIFCKSFSILDWTKILNRDKTCFFTGTDRKAFNIVLGEFIDISNADNIQFLCFSQYDRLYPEFLNIVVEEINNYISLFTISKNTRKHFWDKYNENFFNNLSSILMNYSINDLKGSFKNVPAFIVSAGPSLDKNIKELRNVKDKGIIFSGGRTLGALIKNNITPNFVVSMDPGIEAYNVLQEHANHNIALISTIVSNDMVIQEHQGNQFYISNSEYMELINYFTKKDMDILPLGASVANASAAIAAYLGCNPIVFVGQDLAYTDGKYHAHSCKDEEENYEDEKFEVEGIKGGKVWTNSVWYTFLMWMEKFIHHSFDKLFIDATEGGAKINGTKVLTLKECIENYCKKAYDLDKELKEIIKNNKKEYKEEEYKLLLRNLKVSLDKVSIIVKKALSHLEKINNSFDEGNITEESIQKLHIFEGQIYEIIKHNPGVKDILMRIFEDVNSNKEFIERINETDQEKTHRIINRSKEIYTQIENTIKSIDRLIKINMKKQRETIKVFKCVIHFKS